MAVTEETSVELRSRYSEIRREGAPSVNDSHRPSDLTQLYANWQYLVRGGIRMSQYNVGGIQMTRSCNLKRRKFPPKLELWMTIVFHLNKFLSCFPSFK